MTGVAEIIEKLERGEGGNALDMLVEIALFQPDETWASVRPNHAGTKLIYTQTNGQEVTCLALDWCQFRRSEAIARLRARQSNGDQE